MIVEELRDQRYETVDDVPSKVEREVWTAVIGAYDSVEDGGLPGVSRLGGLTLESLIELREGAGADAGEAITVANVENLLTSE